MKFIGESYSLYAKDIQQIWCRSAKFLWKSKFCSESGSGSGSWYYFGFQHQTYISDIEDTHKILFGSANSFKSYCVHMKSPLWYASFAPRPSVTNYQCLINPARDGSTRGVACATPRVIRSLDRPSLSLYYGCAAKINPWDRDLTPVVRERATSSYVCTS